MKLRLLLLLLALVLPLKNALAAPSAHPSLGPIPAAAQFHGAGELDPVAATNAYLALVPSDKRAASDKYFEGGYWLPLWSAIYTIVAVLLLLSTGVSAKMRDLSERLVRWRWLQVWLYFLFFTLVLTVLTAPLTLYTDYYREHIYNQSHQAFGGWMQDQLIALALNILFGGLVVSLLYRVVRRLPRTWHLWGTAIAIAMTTLAIMVFPVYIAPLFNTYTPITDPAVNGPILRMAHANSIPVSQLVESNASKQTTRVSANVSGLFGTTRITLNDNLLNTASLPEIEAVTGHEMGHYVLNHIVKSVVESVIVFFIFFSLLKVWLTSMQRRHGARWQTRGLDDTALFPAVVLAITVIGLLATPVTNTLTRTQEHEADLFGLNASRQPDGFAQSMLKLGQYRKLEPSAVEEFIFFDHPSGHTRILDAMRWKSQNATLLQSGAASY